MEMTIKINLSRLPQKEPTFQQELTSVLSLVSADIVRNYTPGRTYKNIPFYDRNGEQAGTITVKGNVKGGR